MDLKSCLGVFLLVLSVAVAYPAQEKTDDVELVGGGGTSNRRTVLIPFGIDDDDDDDIGFDFFRGFRDRFSSIFDNLPQIPSFPSFGGSIGFPSGDLPGFNLSEANTTSTRKVINGHDVVINETTYEKPGAFFRVSVINVEPQRGGEGGARIPDKNTPAETTARDVEPVEDSVENEIPKNKETSDYYKYNLDNLETFDDYPKENRPFWGELEPFESFDNNFIERQEPSNYRDLSRDTYVNDLLAAAGAPVNPDAEFVGDINKELQRYPRRQR